MGELTAGLFFNGNNLAGKELLVMKKRCQSSVLEHKRRGGHRWQGVGSSACAWGCSGCYLLIVPFVSPDETGSLLICWQTVEEESVRALRGERGRRVDEQRD